MTDINFQIYKTWKKRIKALGLTQQQVATYSKVSLSRLNQIIKNHANPTVEFIYKIETFLTKEEKLLKK